MCHDLGFYRLELGPFVLCSQIFAAYEEALFLVCKRLDTLCTVRGLQLRSSIPVLGYQMASRDSLCLELCQMLGLQC